MKNIEPKIKKLTADILKDYGQGRTIDKMNAFTSPDMDVVVDILDKLQKIVDILDKLQKILFPGYYRNKNYHFYTAENNLQTLIEDVLFNLTKQISMYLRYLPEYSGADYRASKDRAQEIALEFLSRIPKIRDLVETSVQAEFDGDPAAFNKDEIIFCYPGMYAIMVFRLAHEFYDLGVPMLPRSMSEYAHGKTGIDIHPGATIGRAQQETPSDYRGQRDHLFRRLHSGRRNRNRSRLRHRRQHVHYHVCSARIQCQYQKPGAPHQQQGQTVL